MDTAHPTIADRYASIDPDTLTTDQLLLWGLTHEVIGLRADVLSERRGRRTSNRAIAVVIAVALVIGSLFIANLQAGRDRDRRAATRAAEQTCANRKEASERIRTAVGAAVDEGAIALGATDAERIALDRRVAARVVKEYPPPDC